MSTRPSLSQAVIDATDHPDDVVSEYALSIIRHVHDQTPFVSALQKISGTRPTLKAMADGILKGIASSSRTTAAPVETPEPSVIKGVLLKFNIEPDDALDIRKAVDRLTAVFAQSTPVPAQVFYDPGKTLREGIILEVVLSEKDKKSILEQTFQQMAPAFDLAHDNGNRYKASLSNGPA